MFLNKYRSKKRRCCTCTLRSNLCAHTAWVLGLAVGRKVFIQGFFDDFFKFFRTYFFEVLFEKIDFEN